MKMSLRIASITSKRKSHKLFCNLDVRFIFIVLFCMHEVHGACLHRASLLTSGILNFCSGRTETFPKWVLGVFHAFLKKFFDFQSFSVCLRESQIRSVKPDSMWQHRLTRPLHVPGMYSIHITVYIIYKQNPFTIISRGAQGCNLTDFRLK